MINLFVTDTIDTSDTSDTNDTNDTFCGSQDVKVRGHGDRKGSPLLYYARTWRSQGGMATTPTWRPQGIATTIHQTQGKIVSSDMKAIYRRLYRAW